MKKECKKKQKPYVDDGHTVYDMSGLSGTGDDTRRERNVSLTRKEKRAAVAAAFSVYGPVLLVVLLCFGAAALLIRLWLHV